MKKKSILNSIIIIILGIVLSGAIAYAQTFPNNTPKPINVGSTSQIKQGGLTLSSPFGGLAVFGNSQFNWDVNMLAIPVVTAVNPSPLYVSGKLGVGVSTPVEKFEIAGTGNIRLGALVGSDTRRLCANTIGRLIAGPSMSHPGANCP